MCHVRVLFTKKNETNCFITTPSSHLRQHTPSFLLPVAPPFRIMLLTVTTVFLSLCLARSEDTSSSTKKSTEIFCEQFSGTSCSSCLSHSKCGWCLDTESCVPDELGYCKKNKVHVGELGLTQGLRCPKLQSEETCDSIVAKTCRSCTAVTGCAWCSGTNSCQSESSDVCKPQADGLEGLVAFGGCNQLGADPIEES